jgi:hypothetical protein
VRSTGQKFAHFLGELWQRRWQSNVMLPIS